MATWPKQGLNIVVHDDNMLAVLSREVDEAASQVWKGVSPLKLSSGLYAEWVSTADGELAAWSKEDGHNATGKRCSVVLALPGVEIEGNFLGAAAATNVLAATDYGLNRDLAVSAPLIGGATRGWYILDSAVAAAVRITEFATNFPLPESQNDRPIAGDSDVRLRAHPLISILHWYD